MLPVVANLTFSTICPTLQMQIKFSGQFIAVYLTFNLYCPQYYTKGIKLWEYGQIFKSFLSQTQDIEE